MISNITDKRNMRDTNSVNESVITVIVIVNNNNSSRDDVKRGSVKTGCQTHLYPLLFFHFILLYKVNTIRVFIIIFIIMTLFHITIINIIIL